MPPSTEAGPSRARHEADLLPKSKRSKKAHPEYDPNQDSDVKRELRKQYRSLIADTEDVQKNLASYQPDYLIKMLQRTDMLYSNVAAPQEGVLDARSLKNMSEIGNQMAKSMKLGADDFDIDDFVVRLARFMGGTARPLGVNPAGGAAQRRRSRSLDDSDAEDDEDVEQWEWDKLGRLAGQFSKRAAAMDFLLGPLAIEPKQRKQAARQAATQAQAEQRAPEQIKTKDLQQSSEGDTHAVVRKLWKLLSQRGGEEGVNLFHFAINPKSFSNTIENLFHVSFLIKEGKAMLRDNDDGDPILTAMSPAENEDYEGGVKRRQLMMDLDHATYHEIIEAYGIKESIIPTRAQGPVMRSKTGWYS